MRKKDIKYKQSTCIEAVIIGLFLQFVFAGVPQSAHATPGALDTTFGTGGKVTTAFGSMDRAYSVAIQADGKIVAAGSTFNGTTGDFALARYNTDGSLDTTFGTGGKVTTPFGPSFAEANSVAIQADGKIVAAGDTWNGTSGGFALARYNTDGSLDTTFGTGGKVTTPFDFGTAGVFGVAIQADGKIVAAGNTWNGASTYGYYFALARYNADGSLDTTFGIGGTVTTAFGLNDWANGVAIQADGKIVAAGVTTKCTTGYDCFDFALARFNTDGSLDTAFGAGGKVTTDFASSFDVAYSIAIQADGKIVAAGAAGSDIALARYNPDGSLDTAFGADGKVTTAFSYGEAYSVAIQADGKIVAAGDTSPGTMKESGYFTLARYNTDGSLDTSFGTGGMVTTAFDSGADVAFSIAIQADGGIVAAGAANLYYASTFALARYLAAAPSDTTPPTIGLTCPGTVNLNETAYVSVNVTDTGSGVASQSAPNGNNIADTSIVGTKTFTVTATDNAGNTATSSCTYDVIYNILTSGGLSSTPGGATTVNTAKAGSTIPVKWQLPDGKGSYISDLGVVAGTTSQRVQCSDFGTAVTTEAQTTTSGSSGLRYDTTMNQFIYNWKTTSSMAGSCYTFILQLNDGSKYYADYSLK